MQNDSDSHDYASALQLASSNRLFSETLKKMGTMESPSNYTTDELSAATTTIVFDRPIPLLRGPIRAGSSDDPSSGPYVLAFRDPKSWAGAYKAGESKIKEQCEVGSRIGCAVSAASQCKPPWWRFLIGQKAPSLKERAECEERETEACLATAKEKCVGFSKDKCLKPFREARVAGALSAKQAEKMVCWVSTSCTWMSLIGLDNCGFGVTNCKAEELVGFCDDVDCVSKI